MLFTLFPDEIDETFLLDRELLENHFARVKEHLLFLIHSILLYI
jgi:hypothetical protein